MSPTITVLTNTRDIAADDVVRRLDAAEVEVVRINADLVVDEAAPSWRSSIGSALPGGAVWWRQFELPADGSRASLSVDEVEDVLVARSQWRAWVATLDDGRPWVNPLWAARRAENKIEQLRLAPHVGFRLPDTVITNSLAEVDAFRRSGPAVVKTVAGSYYEMSGRGFVYARDADDVVAPAELWWRQPITVQRRVDGTHVRVVVVGDEVFAAGCESDTLDWRRQTRPSPWTVWTPRPRWPTAAGGCSKPSGWATERSTLSTTARWCGSWNSTRPVNGPSWSVRSGSASRRPWRATSWIWRSSAVPDGLAANLRSGLVKATITPLWLMLPTLPSVIVANARRSAPPGSTDERAAGWAERTSSAEGRDTAILAYETATARLNGLEAKGVGILQACALVAAGALIAYASDSGLAKVLGGIALAYLTLAGWACCRVLVPAPREVVTAEDIGDEEAYARIAAYVEGLAPLAGRVANLVTGAAYDLARASAITLVALLVALV